MLLKTENYKTTLSANVMSIIVFAIPVLLMVRSFTQYMKLRSTYKMMSTNCVKVMLILCNLAGLPQRNIFMINSPVIDNMSNLQIFLDQSLKQE